MKEVPGRCKEILKAAYRERLAGVVVYGSAARGEAGPDSDLDILVLLNGPVDYFKELRIITDILYPVQLESEHHLSAKPVSLAEFHSGRLQIYRNALREGVSV
jgi:predicted nucleotidyltransferase